MVSSPFPKHCLHNDNNDIRVAICSTGELFGGVERHILDSFSALQDQGANPLLLLFHNGELAARASDLEIDSIILTNRNRDLWTTSKHLAGLLAKRRIGVVHVHGYKAMIFCALARRSHRFAIVKTEHGLAEPMRGRPWAEIRERFYRALDGIAMRATGSTVCYVNEDLKTHYQRIHAGLRSVVISNGIADIDLANLQRPSELRDERFNLVMVGRIDTVKGHQFAIEAISTATTSNSLELYVVGSGPREFELRALAEKCGVANQVHFLGFRRNVYDYIAHCHVLLIPSLHEGLPYTLLEAMALGTPLIASCVGGLGEVLEDGVTALLVPPGDSAALARAIDRLCGDQQLGQRLAEKAKRLQRAKYSLDAMSKRYLDLYRSLS